nr:uncharacterized protein LOC105859329 [Microcebus murinus]
MAHEGFFDTEMGLLLWVSWPPGPEELPGKSSSGSESRKPGAAGRMAATQSHEWYPEVVGRSELTAEKGEAYLTVMNRPVNLTMRVRTTQLFDPKRLPSHWAGASVLKNKGGTGQLLSASTGTAGWNPELSPLAALEANPPRDGCIDRKVHDANIRGGNERTEQNTLARTKPRKKDRQSQQKARNGVCASDKLKELVLNSRAPLPYPWYLKGLSTNWVLKHTAALAVLCF